MTRRWRSIATVPSRFGPGWRSYADPDERVDWEAFALRLPSMSSGHAWNLVNSFHLLGTPVPLLENGGESYDLIQIGGIPVVTWERERAYAVARQVSPQGLVDIQEAWQKKPLTEIFVDYVAELWGLDTTFKWRGECYRGRNRWLETSRRGGDVHPSLLEYDPRGR